VSVQYKQCELNSTAYKTVYKNKQQYYSMCTEKWLLCSRVQWKTQW